MASVAPANVRSDNGTAKKKYKTIYEGRGSRVKCDVAHKKNNKHIEKTATGGERKREEQNGEK